MEEDFVDYTMGSDDENQLPNPEQELHIPIDEMGMEEGWGDDNVISKLQSRISQLQAQLDDCGQPSLNELGLFENKK